MPRGSATIIQAPASITNRGDLQQIGSNDGTGSMYTRLGWQGYRHQKFELSGARDGLRHAPSSRIMFLNATVQTGHGKREKISCLTWAGRGHVLLTRTPTMLRKNTLSWSLARNFVVSSLIEWFHLCVSGCFHTFISWDISIWADGLLFNYPAHSIAYLSPIVSATLP